MKYILIFLLFSQLIIAQKSEALSLVDESIRLHDPHGNWSQLAANVNISSRVIREEKETTSNRTLVMNLAKNSFKMIQDTSVYIYPCDNCERAEMFNNYFRYLLGMPMKLHDKGAVIHDTIDLENYKGKQYKVVKVTYDPEVGSDTWKFYFDPQTAELVLSEFSKDGTFQSGETIELNNKTKFQGMILPGQLRWLVLPDRKFLAEENIKYSVIENK